MKETNNEQNSVIFQIEEILVKMSNQISFLIRNKKLMNQLDVDLLMENTRKIYDTLCSVKCNMNVDSIPMEVERGVEGIEGLEGLEDVEDVEGLEGIEEVEEGIENNVENDIEDNDEVEAEDDIEDNVEVETEDDIEDNVEDDIEDNFEEDSEDEVEDLEENLEEDIEEETEEKFEETLIFDFELDSEEEQEQEQGQEQEQEQGQEQEQEEEEEQEDEKMDENLPTPTPTPTPTSDSDSDSGIRAYKKVYTVDAVTLGDKLEAAGDTSLAARLQRKPVTDLATAIGINDKFLLLNELFGGSMEKYNKSIRALNSFSTLLGAKTYMSELQIEFQWDCDTDAYKKLTDLIERRYL